MHFRHAGQHNILLNVEDMAFNEGMAVFFESFVSDPSWVRENLEINEVDQVRYCLQARYAALTWMRTLLVNIRFEHALYTREGDDMDAIYLELQRRCGGFDLPAEAGVRWAADQMIVSHPIYWHTYLIAELIAHQTREAIVAEDGALLGNPRVRSFLMERYYRPGASIPWVKKIEAATGKPLSGDAFFRYLNR
jgi:peptidyl-dipeptidase A